MPSNENTRDQLVVLANYEKKIDVLKVDLISEETAHAVHVLNHISMNMDFYKKNDATLSEDELFLLLDSIKKLPENNEGRNRPNRFVLSDLVSYLITIHDLLMQKNPSKNYYPEIMEAIKPFSDNIFGEIVPSPLSPTAHYLSSKKKRFSKINPFSLETRDDTTFKKHIDSLVRYLKPQKKTHLRDFFNLSDNTSDDALRNNFMAVLELFNNHESLYQEEVIEWITALSKDYSDKEKFVRIFLSVSQQYYNNLIKKNPDSVNIIFGTMINFFPMLRKMLPPQQFFELIAEQPSNTMGLSEESFSAQLLGEYSYYAYDNCLSLYTGKNKDKFKTFYDIHSDPTIYLKLHYQLAFLGENARSKLFESGCLTQLPPLLQTELFPIFEQNVTWKKEFESFVELFMTVNAKAAEKQQRNIKLFFSTNQTIILQIIQTMGIAGIRYLHSRLATTVLNLERTLALIPALPEIAQNSLMHFFQQHDTFFKNNPKAMDTAITCMTILDILNNLPSDNEKIEDYLALSENKSPQEYNLLLAKILLGKVFKGINVTFSEEEINLIFQRVPTEKLVSLIAASNNMLKNEYRDVYLNLLKLDFIGGDINRFLHDTEQENNTGKELAHHNKRIREKLVASDINPEMALNYKETLHFNFSPNASTNSGDQKFLFNILGSYLFELKNAMNRVSGETKEMAEFLKLCKLMEELKKESQGLVDFQSDRAKSLLGDINQNLKALTKKAEMFPAAFNEFSRHTMDQYSVIKEDKRNQASQEKEYSFTIQQWPKEKIDTFFLGDHVGCCLATTNNQFQAMVQRRMDDAMLFHVAVDEKTKKPAALIWLYLAEADNGKIVLVANFFEVNSKYAVNDKLRLTLLNGLLQFTHQYCQSNPNIQSFYMNKLDYGWNIDDLKKYSMTEAKLSDKLGGPYFPGAPIDELEKYYNNLSKNPEMRAECKEMTQKKYYLASLDKKQFHQFEPKKLELVNGLFSRLTAAKAIHEKSKFEQTNHLSTKELFQPKLTKEISKTPPSELDQAPENRENTSLH